MYPVFGDTIKKYQELARLESRQRNICARSSQL